jgi:predicted ArsR family transcriptional regulator
MRETLLRCLEEHGPDTAVGVAEFLGLERPAVSKRLSALVKAGKVFTRGRGSKGSPLIYYSENDPLREFVDEEEQ